MQLTAKHKVATPVNWKPGEDAIILPSVPDAEAREKFPDGYRSTAEVSWTRPPVIPSISPTNRQ